MPLARTARRTSSTRAPSRSYAATRRRARPLDVRASPVRARTCSARAGRSLRPRVSGTRCGCRSEGPALCSSRASRPPAARPAGSVAGGVEVVVHGEPEPRRSSPSCAATASLRAWRVDERHEPRGDPARRALRRRDARRAPSVDGDEGGVRRPRSLADTGSPSRSPSTRAEWAESAALGRFRLAGETLLPAALDLGRSRDRDLRPGRCEVTVSRRFAFFPACGRARAGGGDCHARRPRVPHELPGLVQQRVRSRRAV